MPLQNVLVVEDSAEDHYMAEAVLTRVFPDIKVYKAFDGREALDWLKESNIKPELIFLDINMPGMNGHEFLEVYAQQHNGTIPIVLMLTSSEQKKDKENALQYSFVQDYLQKPMSKDDVRSISELLARLTSQED